MSKEASGQNVRAEMFKKVAKLDNIGATTRKGKRISLSQIYLMLKNPFYYGVFEYPKKSGIWYDASHEPLTTKKLFDEVQKQLVAPQKVKWGSKSFPFRRFLTCYTCGSSIVGEEKFKQRIDGGKNRHVYYHCSRMVDLTCKGPYLSETKLVVQLLAITDKLTIDGTSIDPGLSKAIKKHQGILETIDSEKKYTKSEITKSYSKYVLEKGSDFEKTQLVRNLSVRLAIHDRKIVEINR